MMEREWRRQCLETLAGLPADGTTATVPALPAPAAEAAPFNLLRPRSACPACNTPIRPWHNVPIIGWLWLRGRCAACSARISVRYPLIELLTGVLSAIVAWRFGFGFACAGALLLSWALIALAVIDLDHHLLPTPSRCRCSGPACCSSSPAAPAPSRASATP